MTLQTAPAYISLSTFQHPAELDRNILKAVFGRTGANRPGDFAVTPTGTAQQVSIAAGAAFILGQENNTQGGYFVWNNAAETQLFGVPSAQPRIDTLLLQVEDPQYGSIPGSPLALWRIIAGTPAASPAAHVDADFLSGGSSYIPGAWWRVADVRINPGDTVIPGGQITQPLRYVRSAGGRFIGLSTDTYTDAVVGDTRYDTDTGMLYAYNGSAWRWVGPSASGFLTVAASGADSLTAGTYTDMAATNSFSFTKFASASKVKLDFHVTCYTSGANTTVTFAIQANGVDNDIAQLALNNNLDRKQISGTKIISLPAGTFTMKARWKRLNGTGTLTRASGDDYLSMAAVEVAP